MKNEEDEAFDDLAKKQGSWGGGFQAKRAMAADKLQDGKCEYCVDGCIACDARAQPAQEPVAHLWECLGKWSAYLVTNGKQADCAPPSWLVEAIQNATAPPKREWVGLTDEDTFEIGERLGLADVAWIDLMKAIEAKLKEKNS